MTGWQNVVVPLVLWLLILTVGYVSGYATGRQEMHQELMPMLGSQSRLTDKAIAGWEEALRVCKELMDSKQ